MKNLGLSSATKTEEHHKKLILQYLPGYAQFLLDNYLEDLVKELLKISKEEDVPLLKFFSNYPEEQLIDLGKKSNAELLDHIIRNELNEYIDRTTTEWTANRLPAIDREEIVADDIILISLVRRRAFRNYLKFYTSDPLHFNHVMEDVDSFTAAAETASFNAYISIQQEKIKKINEELEFKNQELLEAQRLSEMGSFFWDIKYGQSSYSPGALEIFGMTTTSTLESFLDNVHATDRARLKEALDKALYKDGLYECEYTYIRNNTEKRIWSRGVVTFEEGQAVSMKGTIMDITGRYTLLQRLQQSEELHKQAQAITHIGNWSWDIATGKILWSDEMYRIYGLEPQSEEITFERFMSLVHPDDRQKRMAEIQESLQTLNAEDYLLQIVNPDGTTKMLKGKGEVITDENKIPLKLNGTCQDITKEYLLNRELQEKEQNFQQLINNAPDGVIVINEESIITLWNPKSEEIFAWTAEEVIGKKITETILPNRYQQAHLQGIKRFRETGESHILNRTQELVACDKTGREFYISLTVSRTTQRGDISFIAFIRDISLQKNTQLELQQKTNLLEYKNVELERINKELESFNYIASHDLQEPLRKIQTFGSRVVAKAKNILPQELLNDLDKIINSSSRMQALIEDLLTFSQNISTDTDTTPVDLNIMLEEVKNSFIHHPQQKQAKIYVQQLPVVRVVAFQFLQLFTNLVGNAIKYQPENNTPEISINAAIVKGDAIKLKDVDLNKNYLMLRITDNGIGFEQEHAEKIFDLFTRLHNKDKYSGTGIGLAICKKIMHHHDGFIKAESKHGEGATFYVYLHEERIVTR